MRLMRSCRLLRPRRNTKDEGGNLGGKGRERSGLQEATRKPFGIGYRVGISLMGVCMEVLMISSSSFEEDSGILDSRVISFCE